MRRFDPATYPGQRPAGPVVVVGDDVLPLRLDGPEGAPLRLAAPSSRRQPPAVLSPGVARFVVAYGSNASPARLMDKGVTIRGAVLLPAVVRGWVAAFEARRTAYGAVPLTLVPCAGAVTPTWLLGVHPDEQALLDRTEGRVATGTPAQLGPEEPGGRFAPPGAYQLGRVGDVEVADRFVARGAVAYLPGPATHLQQVGRGWRTWPAHDQAAAARHVDLGGPAAPAPIAGAADIVLGPWPRTPLTPG